MGISKLSWTKRIRIQRLVQITNFNLFIERWIEGL